MRTVTTRVFVNGNSQAVRIPQEFRLEAGRVQIGRNEHGDLVIRSLRPTRGEELLDILGGFDEEFVAAVQEARKDLAAPQERETLL